MVVVAQPQAQTYPDPPPVINAFTANPSYIQAGQTVVLTWYVTDADTVTISPAIGSVSSSGSYNVTPAYTTTYTLTAANSDGSVSASTTVTVAPYAPYASTLNTSSGSEVASGESVSSAGSSGVLTLGLGGDNRSFNSWLLYILLIGLLAVAVVAAIVFIARKPAVAYSGSRAGTRAGYLSSATNTRVADESAHTTPVATGPGPKFIASDGAHVPISGNAGSLGRSDFRSMVKPDKAELISRKHIWFDCEDGECFIEDRNSTNGTKINGSRISGEGRFLLRDGDVVDLAGVLTLTFKI